MQPGRAGSLGRWAVSVIGALALLGALESAVPRRQAVLPAGPVVSLELVALPASAARTAAPVTPMSRTSAPAAVPAPAAPPAETADAMAPTAEAATTPASAQQEAVALRSAAREPPPAPLPPRAALARRVENRPAALALRTGPTGLESPPAAPPAAAVRPAPAVRGAPSRPAATAPRRGSGPPLVAAQSLDPGFRLTGPVRPRYPEAARRLGRPGTVHVELEVAPDGAVTRVAVQEEAPGWGFGDAAREAFGRARFTPPSVNGEPVRVRWRKTLHFRP